MLCFPGESICQIIEASQPSIGGLFSNWAVWIAETVVRGLIAARPPVYIRLNAQFINHAAKPLAERRAFKQLRQRGLYLWRFVRRGE